MKNIQSKLAMTLSISAMAFSAISSAGEMPTLENIMPPTREHLVIYMDMPVLEVQEELKMPTLDDNSYNGRPVGQGQPRPRENKPRKSKTLPDNLGVDAYNGRPAGQPQPRPRGAYVVPVAVHLESLSPFPVMPIQPVL